jgi:hypothetical protein
MVLNPFAGREKSRSWFWWGINLGVLLALFIWWWLENKPKEQVKIEIKAKPLVLPDDEPGKTPAPTKAASPECSSFGTGRDYYFRSIGCYETRSHPRSIKGCWIADCFP